MLIFIDSKPIKKPNKFYPFVLHTKMVQKKLFVTPSTYNQLLHFQYLKYLIKKQKNSEFEGKTQFIKRIKNIFTEVICCIIL